MSRIQPSTFSPQACRLHFSMMGNTANKQGSTEGGVLSLLQAVCKRVWAWLQTGRPGQAAMPQPEQHQQLVWSVEDIVSVGPNPYTHDWDSYNGGLLRLVSLLYDPAASAHFKIVLGGTREFLPTQDRENCWFQVFFSDTFAWDALPDVSRVSRGRHDSAAVPFSSDEGFIAACDIGGGSVVWQDRGIDDRITMYTISTGALREVPLPALPPPTAAYAEGSPSAWGFRLVDGCLQCVHFSVTYTKVWELEDRPRRGLPPVMEWVLRHDVKRTAWAPLHHHDCERCDPLIGAADIFAERGQPVVFDAEDLRCFTIPRGAACFCTDRGDDSVYRTCVVRYRSTMAPLLGEHIVTGA